MLLWERTEKKKRKNKRKIKNLSPYYLYLVGLVLIELRRHDAKLLICV